MQLKQSPFDVDDLDDHGIQMFREHVWYNSELCSNCFARVRDVGPVYSKILRRSEASLELPDLDMRTNEWYERTPNGSQEHTPFDHNRRFGTCFCLDCGSDCTANHRLSSLDELRSLAGRIVAYVTNHTDQILDAEAFFRELGTLKRTPEYQSWETEILAVAFSRGLEDSR